MRANDGNTGYLSSVILGIVVLGLAGTVGTISLLREVGEIGPKVGDIISFDPLETLSRDMNVTITATRSNAQPGAHAEATCVLNIGAMHAGGGSAIIEARLPQTSSGYRVHWAGPHGGDSVGDCGASADLLLNQEDIETLAMAAGGYGVSSRRLAANTLWNARPPAQ